MKKTFFYCLAFLLLLSCNSKKEDNNRTKKTGKNEYTITKDGINDLKIGMTKEEVEKLLDQHFDMDAKKDSAGYWSDTIKTKYKTLDVALYFERQYVTQDSGYMQLNGIETSSPLCSTNTGISIGDTKHDILPAYEENPINMGYDYEMVNDTTWAPSKTKYSINVKDDKWDRELIFHLMNNKITSIQASVIMGD
ncbi:MAG TPA: hypothetical protein VK483_10555 [Chitinophagaceae bacterium]|nr:hypothetical protein [Chitinophagaceae bacterium]